MRPPTDTGLPVEASTPDIVRAIADRRRCVLVAEPGAGKTTVVPLRLLAAARDAGLDGGMLLLEPRRVAARAAARRLAALIGESVGDTVGLITRDDRRLGPDTRLTVVTEGILTRRLQNDPGLDGIGLVVFDEFHERSLQADVGLALALDAAASLRPDLALMVMSATIDAERVAELIGGDRPAPVVASPGRLHPIDVRWAPRRARDRLEPAVAAAVRSALREEGDVLVFLPGMGEIRRCATALDEIGLGPDVDVELLHGSLPARDQDRALTASTPGRRKVVLSTDIAETSLTVEGVRSVIDAGLARVPRFDAGTGMTRLVTVPASKASTEQRAGRAGRLAPGIAIRLWSKMEHAGRPPHSPAEITQVELSGLALELAVWGVGGPGELAFLDQPPRRAWDEATALLRSLGALDEAGRPTTAGIAMGDIPVHPRLARLLLDARSGPSGWTACLVAALLDERDVLRGRPDELPADLGLRLELLSDPDRRHPAADGRALRSVRDRARDLARRLGVDVDTVDPEAAGSLLLSAFPDRVATRRGTKSRGRFRLRSGGGAWVLPTDPLADAEVIVAADVDGRRSDARVRLGAAVDPLELALAGGEQVTETESLVWDNGRNELVLVSERRLDGLQLARHESKPTPGPATTAALLDRVRDRGLDLLGWDKSSRNLRTRMGFLHRHRGDPWPDMSDDAMLDSAEDWLGPFIDTISSRRELVALDLSMVLGALLGWDLGLELDRLAPRTVTLPSGREVVMNYADDQPIVAAKVQEFFGCTEGPAVLGGEVPVVLHLLSPANRPIQVTSDLAGFWTGSWHDVRKDLAGRYPKHAWPEDPSTTPPHRK